MPHIKKPTNKWRYPFIILFVGCLYWLISAQEVLIEKQTNPPNVQTNLPKNFKQLVTEKASDTLVEVSARVYQLLSDDKEGSRHQRFLVNIEGISVLVAHNIDLAPRVPLKVGDQIRLKGEYEWNEKGGVIHWTHHDPKKWHEDGWIEHQGKKFK